MPGHMLKTIYIKGFKSFHTPVLLDINAPINIFIGPNGCGKSNIFDSFLWILAEQNIKKLRGEKARDLIFNGTDKRSPSNYCEVVLEVIPQKEDPASPFSITRRIFRNDTSQFFINNKNSRLLDIKNKLHEHELNLSPFSFISQGNVENLLNKKPSELKELFEEVAGISKYKKIINNYQETISQKSFEFNLLNEKKQDILDKLNILKKQSDKAIDYQIISKERQNILKESLILQYRLYFDKVTSHKTKKIKIDAEKKEIKEKHDILLGKETEISKDLDSKIDDIKITDREMNQRLTKKIELQSNINLLAEKININEAEYKRLNDELILLKKTGEDLKSKLAAENKRARTLMTDIQKHEEAKSSLHDKYITLKDIYDESITKFDQAKKDIDNISLRIKDTQNNLVFKEKELYKLELNLDNIKKGLRNIQAMAEKHNKEAACLNAQIMQNREKQNQITHSLAALSVEIEKYNKSSNDQKASLDLLKDRIIADRSELKTIIGLLFTKKPEILRKPNDLIKNREGYIGIFYELFKFRENDLEYIDAYMGPLANSLVFEKDKDMMDFIQYYKKTNKEKSFLSVTSLERLTKETGTECILDGRQFHVPVKIIREECEMDINILSGIDAYFQDLLVKDPFIIINPLVKEKPNLISQKHKVDKLEVKIRENERQETEFTKSYQDIINTLKGLIDQNSLLKRERDQTANSIKSNTDKINSINMALRELEKEIDIQKNKELFQSNTFSKTDQELADLQNAMKALEEIRDDIQLRFQGSKTEVDSLSIELNNYKKKLNNHDIIINKLKTELDYTERTINSLKNTASDNNSRTSTILHNINDIDESLISLKDQNIFFINEQKLLQGKIGEIAESKKQQIKVRNTLQQELKKIKERKSENYKILDSLEQQLRKVEISHEKYSTLLDITKREYLDKGFSENDIYSFDFNININDAALEGYKNNLRNLDGKLKNLGEINPLAIKEFEKENKKYKDYLSGLQDIENAIKELDILIKKTNKEAIDKYYYTVLSIEKNFSELFSKLFNGGKAKISLTEQNDPDEVLPIPVPDIIINPPGKNISRINLLSGGEKALSALALIFSLFLFKPSPFCFLDEVDASLDEINTERFINLVREFSSNTQFFIITHNRQTMAIGDYIYGITSEEKGISKVLSISFI